MYNLIEIIGKQVIGLFEAKGAGTVSNALFDKSLSRIKYFEIFTDDENDAEKKYFSPDSITTIGDAIVLKNLGKLSAHLSRPDAYIHSPVSLTAFNPSGNILGKVTDVILDDGFTASEFSLADKAFAPATVLTCSDELIIFNDTDKKIKLTPPATRVPSPKKGRSITVKAHTQKPVKENTTEAVAEQPVTISANPLAAQPTVEVTEQKTEKVAEQPATETAQQIADTPTPTVPPKGNVSVSRYPAESSITHGGYAFLLGKLVTKTIFRDDGVALIAGGEYVDEKSLAAVAAAGKLVQLALHSK